MKNKKRILVTGSAGLVGSEVCTYFSKQGFEIHGIDNNFREMFFGSQGSTLWNTNRLINTLSNFRHYDINICDRNLVEDLIITIKPDIVIHTAAQPSHDKAADIPFMDFDVNA